MMVGVEDELGGFCRLMGIKVILCLSVYVAFGCAVAPRIIYYLVFPPIMSNSRLRPLERPGADSRGAARSVRGHKAQPGDPL